MAILIFILLVVMFNSKVSVTPSYKTTQEEGPDHNKQFTVAVFLGKDEVARGDGKSKQEAEQEAARNALQNKKWL